MKERIIMKEDRRGEKTRWKRGKKIEKFGHDPPCGEIYITKTKTMVEKNGEPTPPPLSGTLNKIRIRKEKPKRK